MFGNDRRKKGMLCDAICGDTRPVLLRSHRKGCPYWRQDIAEKLREWAEEIAGRRANNDG